MVQIDINNIVSMNRGDSFTTTLFLNKGTDLEPLRYILNDCLYIEKTTTLVEGSILKAGSLIKESSSINNIIYNEDVSLEEDLVILYDSSLSIESFINKGSLIKANSIINSKTIKDDLLIEGDEIYLAICEPNQPFECALVKKKYNSEDLDKDGDVKISIEHDDTKCLLPGKYYYMIKAKFLKEDGKFMVNTVVPFTEWFILE